MALTRGGEQCVESSKAPSIAEMLRGAFRFWKKGGDAYQKKVSSETYEYRACKPGIDTVNQI